ncbi:LisH domain and HEAT repeat-containing protein [Schistosoma japonicum]|uniref:LisH domain and HEAT repeat-containing protein n=1 Tax=Schistosoma japonicum TaxID=6182 RepID=A0A4Z2DBN4_SCHJA|nr:LisH domain and HEAT repeat-containing protein [Schistosoma japonicum]TNN13922.1 LisH domain and HEAT repeat-containing protein [Schistosoma japonicum]
MSVHLEKPPHPNFNDDRIQSHKLNENVQKIDDNRKSIEVAEYLLDKKLFLSALEYYFEQLERGKSIKILHEFFTSPNFVDNLNLSSTESSNLLVGKYSSLSSLDSSDIGRISDDGNTLEEKLKVLEYELRKKNDEISTLRNELTSLVACGFKSDTLTSQTSDSTWSTHFRSSFNNGGHKTLPHELRAISFLINEYFLEQNFRLTAIQFAEEVEEHGLPSLESWHEVAINLRKPPSILSLLRSYWYPSTSQSSPNRVDLPTPNFCEVAIQTESEQNVYTVTVGFDEYSSIELQSKNEEISLLKSKINHLESQYSAASQNVKDLHNQLICLKREHVEMIDKTLLTKHTTITSNQTVKVNDSDDDCNQSNLSNTDNPSYSQKKYLPDRINKSRRKLSTEFSKYIAHLLPDDDMLLNEINRNFHLTDSLDEFVTFLAQYIEKILTYLVDKGKLIFLPLLVQIICLHPNSSVRDRFLCLLFDFLSSTSSTSLCQQSPASVENKIHFDFLHHSSTLLMKTMKSNSDSLVDVGYTNHDEFSKHILNALRLLALYLGPTRLEGELLPCLWLQINKCTISDLSKRLFLVSACGVIAPHLPSHLQSSIMLSIMESSLDEERDTTVLAASIRSLSCLTSSMSDSHKLSQIIRRLNSLLVQTVNIFSDEQQLKLFYLSSKHSSSSAAGGIASLSNPVYHSIMNYFLPSIAQWCLELDSIQQNLLDPWLIHLDNYILARQNTKDEVVPDTTLLYLNAFYYLTPFLHAWLLLSLIKKSTPDECIWTAMQNLLQIYRNSASEFEHLLMQNFIAKENESTVKVSPISSNLVDTPMILGQDSFELLSEMMKYLCQSEKKQSPSISSTQASSFVEQSFYSNHLCQMDEWLAKQWLDKYLLSKLIHLLEQLPYCNGGHCLQIKSFLDLDYANYSFDDVIKHQFDEYFVYPCTESLQSNNFKVAFSICRFLVSIGHALKSDGVIKLIAPHFKAKLMKQTEHGNYEYDHNSIQTGLLAGYCCLLSSTQSKSELDQVRMLLTSAIFLHAREGFPLHCINLTIWCLCLTTDLNITIQEILLPAIRPCLSCTDSSVRRAAANLLHALIEILRFIGGSSHHHTHGNAATVAIFPTIQNDICKSNLFGLIWPFLSQVSRDDLTGQRKRITPDQADWSVLCCSLGPLYSFLLLICVPYLNSTLSSPSATYIPASTGDPPRNCKVDSVSLPTSTTIDTNIVPITDTLTIFSEYANYRTMAFDLLSLQYDLVVGRTSPNELNSNVHNSGIDYTMDRLIISQRRFWSTLVNNLLDLTNRLLPICGENFQQNRILPWLFDLAEMNNTLPSLELRVELANHLFTVFSTAAYSVQNEQSLLQWLVPGLDRVRLDLIECGDNRRIREVEQFLSDLYSTIRLNDQGRSSNLNSSTSIRTSVSNRWTKLTSFNSSNINTTNNNVSNSTDSTINSTTVSNTNSVLNTCNSGSNMPSSNIISDPNHNSPPEIEMKKIQSRTKNLRFNFRRH